MKTPIFLNAKGCALLAAIDSGLIPEQNGGYDIDQFEKFWSSYMDHLDRMYRATEAPGEMLSDHAKSERDAWHYFIKPILLSSLAMLSVTILMSFFGKFGVRIFVACLILCLSSGLFAREI